MDSLPFQIALLLAQVCLVILAGFFLIRPIRMLIFGRPDAPPVPTPRRAIFHIAEALAVRPGDIVYDLGSGDGRVLLQCAKLEPSARFVGIERSFLLHYLARFRAFMSGSPTNVSFLRQDILLADLSPATKLYTYLCPTLMNQLLPKIEHETCKVRVVSYVFAFKAKRPSRTIHISSPRARRDTRLHVYDF